MHAMRIKENYQVNVLVDIIKSPYMNTWLSLAN